MVRQLHDEQDQPPLGGMNHALGDVYGTPEDREALGIRESSESGRGLIGAFAILILNETNEQAEARRARFIDWRTNLRHRIGTAISNQIYRKQLAGFTDDEKVMWHAVRRARKSLGPLPEIKLVSPPSLPQDSLPDNVTDLEEYRGRHRKPPHQDQQIPRAA